MPSCVRTHQSDADIDGNWSVSRAGAAPQHAQPAVIAPDPIVQAVAQPAQGHGRSSPISHGVSGDRSPSSNSRMWHIISPIDCVITARKDCLIPLDLRFEIPIGWDLTVHNKSGVCTKKKLTVGAHLIDGDYRGNCHIHFFNNSDEDVIIKRGDKISQLVMRQVWLGSVTEVDEISTDTVRSEGGFGHTGDK